MIGQKGRKTDAGLFTNIGGFGHLNIQIQIMSRTDPLEEGTNVQESPVPIINAATMVCLRRRENDTGSIIWQVLLGQNEAINWLRSTRDQKVVMRYPGEWKFPGGAAEDEDCDFSNTAIRELNEEFLGISAPTDGRSKIHLFNTKLTMAVKEKRYRMYNFIALEDENEWLQHAHVEEINQKLDQRKQMFQQKLKDGTFWTLSRKEKLLYSPETYRVDWIDLHRAIHLMDISYSPYVDTWQAKEFQSHGIATRDPMYQSQSVLLEIQDLRTREAILHQAASFTSSLLQS